ncbi:MAG: YlbE-like family protein [Bacilli bacterium]
MSLDTQFKIQNNPYYVSYLRNNAYWYKLLTRNPNLFNEFEISAKEFYKIRKTDKLEKTLKYIEIFQSIMSSLK